MGLHVDRGDGMAPGPSEFRSSVEGVAAFGVFKKKTPFWKMSGSLPTCRSCRKLLDALAMASPHIGIGKIKMLRLGAFWLAVSCSRAHHWLTLQHLTLVFLKSGKLEAPGDTGEVWGWTVNSWLKFLLQAFSDLFPQVRGWFGTRVTCQSRSLYVDLARVTRVGGLFHGVF
jgi:hypothetical protein